MLIVKFDVCQGHVLAQRFKHAFYRPSFKSFDIDLDYCNSPLPAAREVVQLVVDSPYKDVHDTSLVSVVRLCTNAAHSEIRFAVSEQTPRRA
jgi:hypothetical protein